MSLGGKPIRIGLVGPDKNGLGGPIRNWAWWAIVKLGLMGQCKTGLDGLVRNWAWLGQCETTLDRLDKTKLRLDKTRLKGHSKLALWKV